MSDDKSTDLNISNEVFQMLCAAHASMCAAHRWEITVNGGTELCRLINVASDAVHLAVQAAHRETQKKQSGRGRS